LNEERRPFEDMPRFSTLLLTALAWHTVRGELRIDRLPTEVVADFLRTTASRRTADPEAPARAMTRLLDALEAEADLSRRPAATLRAFGTTCLDRLAADCGNLDPGMPVTPRVVGCLRLG
jgi:predicted LPLAT superfamily acyltransferase